ncbi:unnamed protein product [Ceutorhynchus assimilis]|uniref:Uncharacterized protein n=1 Tax=Ceutorhynchus assimilis TaxID=467358 RepID=A0A9N9MP44_9CUCU|nr:unnamed protein product [Ceutorhynchus assimilis]
MGTLWPSNLYNSYTTISWYHMKIKMPYLRQLRF